VTVRYILLRGFGVVFLVFILGCVNASEGDSIESNVASALEEDSMVNDGITEAVNEDVGDGVAEVGVVNVGSNPILGPGGCTGDECNEYFKNNPEESQTWCDENPVACDMLKAGDNSGDIGPGGCLDDCEEFCDKNAKVCQEWCTQNLDKSPELCGFMAMEGEALARQGDGVWEKDELSFYILDTEKVLTKKKRDVIVGTITSERKYSNGFLGWNAALQELNNVYPDNIVPNKMFEVTSASEADLIIEVHSEKEYCCDLAGLPVQGIERSTIDENNAKILSDVDIYNIVAIDAGFLEDMTMHEIGHSLGLFGHVTDRQNDLMSLISPGRGIKAGNLNDLYVKYKDRIIETVEATRERDQAVKDQINSPPGG
jgi:hypothetical protein